MTTVVGLDLSLVNSGVVVVRDDVSIERAACPVLLRSCGRKGREGENYRTRSRRVRKQVRDVLDLLIPVGLIDLAVIEGPIYAGNFTGSYFDRAGVWHGVFGALDARNIPIAVIPPTTGHIFTTGKGSLPKDPKAFKPLIVRSVAEMLPGVSIPDDDVADAAGLALMGAMSLGIPMPFRIRRWHAEAVHTAIWPHNLRVHHG